MLTRARDPRVLDVQIEGDGRVVSRPAGLVCPGACRATFERGRGVRLTAAAAPGAAFAGWSGGCEGTGTCRVRLDRSRSVQTRFRAGRRTATLTVDPTGDGVGTVISRPARIDCGVACRASFPVGERVTLTAQEASGSVFRGWSGAACSGTGTCEVTLDGDRRVVARFEAGTTPAPSHTLGVEPTGEGTVSSDPPGIACGDDCEEAYDEGAVIRLVAEPVEGVSELTGWGADECADDELECVIELLDDRTIAPVFGPVAKETWTLTLGVGGDARLWGASAGRRT